MHQFLVQPTFDWQMFGVVVTVTGDLLWLLAYILTIRVGFKDKAFGIPMLAICFNFSWEFIYVVLEPSQNSLKYYLDLSWLLADSIIVYQLARYGKKLQPVPQMRKHFYAALVVTMAFCFLGQLAYHRQFLGVDPYGYQSAYNINLMMSILFIFLFFDRQDLRGLSYGAAWAKMLGTGVLSLGTFIYLIHKGDAGRQPYMEFLFASIFVCDVFYIYLLHSAGTALAQSPTEAVGAGA
jgi:hypothetical protein